MTDLERAELDELRRISGDATIRDGGARLAAAIAREWKIVRPLALRLNLRSDVGLVDARLSALAKRNIDLADAIEDFRWAVSGVIMSIEENSLNADE